MYKLLLMLKKPEEIYLINSCNKAPLVKACKDCGVVVNEIQHGIMVREDLVAHFPGVQEDSLDYFPDKFLIWEDSYMNTSKLPLSAKNIIKSPNRHLQQMLQNNMNIARTKNQVLIISQPFCSQEIYSYVLKNVGDLKDYRIIYKLHPVENANNLIDTSPGQCTGYDNLTFTSNQESIYKLFRESTFVIGVYSTAIFEAVYFGCKVLLLNLPGVEMANSLLENNSARLINSDDRLVEFLT